MKANYQTPDGARQTTHKLTLRIDPTDRVHITTYADNDGHISISFESRYGDLFRRVLDALHWGCTEEKIKDGITESNARQSAFYAANPRCAPGEEPIEEVL